MRGALGVVALLLVFAVPAEAHIRSTTGYSNVKQDGATVHYQLELEYQPLAFAAGLGQKAIDGTPPVRAEILRAKHAAVEAYLSERLVVSAAGVECPATLEGTAVTRRDGLDFAELTLGYACPGADAIAYEVFADGGVIDDHRNVVDYRLDGGAGTFVFDGGHHKLQAGASAVTRFVATGVEHILFGLDHVLFLFVLLLGAKSLKSVIKLATAFTAAHSVTLALGALGWVSVPPEIIEPLIALSIFYVALENIFGGETRHRLGVVFAFGLLHGLGFAGSLSFTGELNAGLLGSLVSFNVGIELGQALLVAAVFPLLLLARRYRWSPPAHVAATSAAAAMGLFWFTERLI